MIKKSMNLSNWDKEEFYKDIEAEIVKYSVFIKPTKGSASIKINKVNSKEEIEILFDKFNNLIIQELMNGTEYGVDAYTDMISGEIAAIFTKKVKIRVRETDKSVSMKDNKIFELIKHFSKKTGLKEIIDEDIFKVDDEYFISEANPCLEEDIPKDMNARLIYLG